jgi:hypothetical protein
MKCELTNSILTFALGALAVAGVIFALQTVSHTHELRSLTVQATIANNNLLQAQALVNDVIAYNQKTPSPELTKMLQAIQAKPAAH